MTIQRQPLTTIQNASTVNKKVQRTYGKKSKASSNLHSAKEIFTMTSSIEEKLEQLQLSEDNAVTEKTCTKSPCRALPRSRTKELPQQKVATKTRAKRSEKGKGRDIYNDSGLEIDPCLRETSSEDQAAIQELVSQYSDRNVLSFERYGNTISKKYDVKKIGEGSFSSVFALRCKSEPQNTPPSATLSGGTAGSHYRTTILKLMPVLIPSQAHLEPAGQTSPCHIASELRTMRTMDPIHGFLRYRGLLVVKGSWPASFLDAFRTFKSAHRKKAENEDPEDAFDDSQYYALVEMEDAGVEICDALKRPSDFQIYDIFWQTAIHLANAESVCGFEHRDLHVSNICIKADDITDPRMDITADTVSNMVEKPDRLLGLSNISVTLIDYTFSRATLPSDHNNDDLSPTTFREFLLDGPSYDDLCKQIARGKKPPTKSAELFEDRVQQLTYAKVAKLVDLAHTSTQPQNTSHDPDGPHTTSPWQLAVPASNVAWLGYLITCLLGRAGKVEKTKYVAGSSGVAKRVQDGMRRTLSEIRDVLMVEDVESEDMLQSAAEVVRVGVERGWLGTGEIEWFRERLEEES